MNRDPINVAARIVRLLDALENGELDLVAQIAEDLWREYLSALDSGRVIWK